MKVIIVGGVAGGATAAARIRRLSEEADITIYERTSFVSYANCGLPYYIGDVINDDSNLTLATPSSLYNRYRINVKTSHEVIDIDSISKKVTVKDLMTQEVFTESYDKLLLSPGAKPLTLDFLNTYNNVFTLRTVEDTVKIKDVVTKTDPKKVAVIGGGFVGLEMTENLVNLGIEVTLIHKDESLLNILDYDMSSFVYNHLISKGVKVLLSTDAIDIIDDSYDMILVSIGIKPDNTLAEKAGLELDLRGSILVNDKMETSVKDIYAVGDAVSIKQIVTGEVKMISLAGPANKEARVAADNICGLESHYKGSLSSSVLKVFDLTVATTGITEKVAKSLNYDYEKVILSPSNHASYYPGATQMHLKVIYDKNTKLILGAQAVGKELVEKRIDVIATAIYAKLSALDLKDLDLCYAPPYNTAKDPVNLAGFIIDNIESGIVKQFYYEDIEKLQENSDVILLDTRTPQEYKRGFVEGFINIPLDVLRGNLHLLDKTKKIYVMCHSGMRSYLSSRILLENGFEAYNFVGGYLLFANISKMEANH